jgi:hypothetical protein
MDTLTRKLNAMTERYNKMKDELKECKKELSNQTTSSCRECNDFRKAVGSSSKDHKHKKRRQNRAKTPDNFWSINNF